MLADNFKNSLVDLPVKDLAKPRETYVRKLSTIRNVYCDQRESQGGAATWVRCNGAFDD